MRKKIKVYLCDFVHNYFGAGTYMFPLNIGYLASYAKKFFAQEFDIVLFKYPNDFIKQFKNEIPDIVGFSHYTWNADLNKKISKFVKSIAPKTIVIFGGPEINHSLAGHKQFFISYDSADFYIPYQGETPFINLLRKIIEHDLRLSAIKKEPVDGVIFYNKNEDVVIQGNDTPFIKDLDTIPSPYLTGLLDEFFDTFLIPIVETNRGCPYTCTFCAQGASSHNSITFFKLDRVKEELNYIASRTKNTNILNFADSNFGMLERDMEISKYLAELREKIGYPRKLNTNWAKNQPRLFEIARALTNSSLIISLQSVDDVVLKNVKRTNIKLSTFKDIIDKINAAKGVSGTEIILGLPGETKQSHIDTIKQLFDWNVSYMICYNALILNGTEMALDRESGKFITKTKFRLIDNCFGKYNGITSLEAEEGIRSTSAISEEDILYFRPVHWLIMFLWNYRFYFPLLKYLQSLQINPFDYIVRLIDNVNNDSTPEKIKGIFNEFKKDAENEWFDSFESFYEYYSQPQQFKLLEEGRYGKLNGRYIFRVLLESREDFEKYLYKTASEYSSECQAKKAVLKELINFSSSSIIDVAGSWDKVIMEKDLSYSYDILAWESLGYGKALEKFYNKESVKYSFYLLEEQRKSMDTLLKQYTHKNKNVTLRKMSEFMYLGDFFYNVRHEVEANALNTGTKKA